MSIFYQLASSYRPVFQMYRGMDCASRPTSCPRQPMRRSFAPRFNVLESNDSYELTGELPGVEKSQINVEWSHDSVLRVSGRVEPRQQREQTRQQKQKQKEKHQKQQAEEQHQASESNDLDWDKVEIEAIAESESDPESSPASNYQKASAEDEPEEAQESVNHKASQENKSAGADNKDAAAINDIPSRFLMQERNAGNFSRSFQFPVNVDQDGVRARFENGVLSITVGKQNSRK